jgi:NTE family protein
LPADDLDINNLYTWKQIRGDAVSHDGHLLSTLSFTAPYVKGNQASAKISFELTIKDNKGKPKGSPYTADVIVKRVHRAMIFQGGAALGAYEAGTYEAIVQRLVKENEGRKLKGLAHEKRPLFDIVAGTSIGSMNGAIVVSSVTEEGKSLDDMKTSAEVVKKFWKYQMSPTVADFLDNNPIYRCWWDIAHTTSKLFKRSASELADFYWNLTFVKWYNDVLSNSCFISRDFWKDCLIDGWYVPATAEASRRYYSGNSFMNLGALHVASGIPTGVIPPWTAFGKFFDLFQLANLKPRADNHHFTLFSLKKTLEQFARFPIKTKEGQPRFLVVTVDVKTGDAVTFDSYSEQAKYHDDTMSICDRDGIEIEHALASFLTFLTIQSLVSILLMA